jgi:membrane protease YdiL (CAAX protease family)
MSDVGGQPATVLSSRRIAGLAVVGYYLAYLGYLFAHPEPEWTHWITLVLVPLLGVAVLHRNASLRFLLASIGLAPTSARRGWLLTLALCLGFQAVQLLNTAQVSTLRDLLGRPLGWLLPLGAFVMLLGTAATTEEIFFRGILQTRLADATGREGVGFVLATVAFALYHVPYTYLVPGWSSAGHLGAAFRAAMVNGLVGGIPLGIVFWRSRRNLAAAIVLHAAIDLIPGIVLLARLLPR